MKQFFIYWAIVYVYSVFQLKLKKAEKTEGGRGREEGIGKRGKRKKSLRNSFFLLAQKTNKKI